DPDTGEILIPELGLKDRDLAGLNRLCFVACGTSWHAALVGKYLVEEFARLPVEVDIASEFRYRRPVLDGRVLTVPISQSGETADTLAALRAAKDQGSRVVAICNVVGSSMAREDRKSTRLNSSHVSISYAVFCLKKKKKKTKIQW